MPFCPSCGAKVEGSFCGSCGARVGDVPPAAMPAQAGASPSAAVPAVAGLQDNVAGALCYLLGIITGVLFLVLEPYNRNRQIRFHAFQSIFLHVALIAVWIALAMLGILMRGIFSIFGLLLIPVHFIVGIGAFILWIVLLVKTFNGSKLVLPVIGPLAEKQAG
ncbi:MAG TPA: hypothetical protein VFA54_16435 [Bryobacterales bacterium]|jgi:uncharacterized membrane protein|nr:hypothetical protein [Bryobacterales bacterium]